VDSLAKPSAHSRGMPPSYSMIAARSSKASGSSLRLSGIARGTVWPAASTVTASCICTASIFKRLASRVPDCREIFASAPSAVVPGLVSKGLARSVAAPPRPLSSVRPSASLATVRRGGEGGVAKPLAGLDFGSNADGADGADGRTPVFSAAVNPVAGVSKSSTARRSWTRTSRSPRVAPTRLQFHGVTVGMN